MDLTPVKCFPKIILFENLFENAKKPPLLDFSPYNGGFGFN